MQRRPYITLFFILIFFVGFSQVQENRRVAFQVKGSVKGEKGNVPISGVEVSTDWGEYAITNALGKFKIAVAIGDEIRFESLEIRSVTHIIKSKEDVDVIVKDYELDGSVNARSKVYKNTINLHQTYLDSAERYKKIDIKKSIDFITQSISKLGKRGNKKAFSRSLSALGEIYQYHKQYDLAIANFKDALEANKSVKTTLLLGKVYNLNGEHTNAKIILEPLLKIKKIVPFQQIALYEYLGDSYKGLNQIDQAVAFYNRSLQIAKQNQVTPKLTDLTSKIADAYAKDDREVEADAYYENSLKLSKNEAPKRAIQEKEKVADFYNKKNRYDEEITLRKQSLGELKGLSRSVAKRSVNDLAPVQPDTISAQRINYKIANAYISQNKLDEAIPYLEKSIVEAGGEDDLIVQKDAVRKLSEVYEYKGNFPKAFESFKTYTALVDTLYIRKEQEISRATRFNREITSKQNRISGLEQERELFQSKYDLAITEQALVAENYKRQQWVIYSLIFVMLALALAAFFFYRSNNQQKLANNLLALKSLRSQMNPHFIFNALNSVNNFIAKSDERSANRYLSEFSTLMRAVLENSEEDFIPLSKELELLELYTKLEHSRFTDKFDYEITIDEHIDVTSFKIPPMLLQPYIENAIWHGLRYREEKGLLKIGLRQKDKDTLEISILDNGIGRKKSAELKTSNQKKQKSKGMGNIKKRIAILNDMYKDTVAVNISDLEMDGAGTKVLFMLKKDR